MRAYIALFLAQIMLITLLSPFVSADDVETSGDVSWNGTLSWMVTIPFRQGIP